MIARTYLEPMQIRPLRDVAPLNHRVTFRQPLNVGLTRFWREQAADEKYFHAPAFFALMLCIAAMLASTAWETAHIDSTLRGAVAVFDRSPVPAMPSCNASACSTPSTPLQNPQRVSNPSAAGMPSMPSITLKFGVLLP